MFARPPLLSESTYYAEERVFNDRFQPVEVRCQLNEITVPHRHNFTELVFVTGGTSLHQTAAGRRFLSTGDFFVVEGAQYHAYLEVDRLELINVIIRNSVIDGLRLELRTHPGYRYLFCDDQSSFVQPRRLIEQELTELTQLATRIGEENINFRSGKDLLIRGLLINLLVMACRFAMPIPARREQQAEVGRIIDYLEKNFTHNIYMSQLEDLSFLTVRSLQRKFLKATGCTPMRYLLRIRIAHAARLLRETELKVSDISRQSGFIDNAYFLRQFKLIMGRTPGCYRRQLTTVADGDAPQTP